MSDLRKAAEAVLEAWGWDWSEPRNEALKERMEALRQALAQPEQKPVAWSYDEAKYYPTDVRGQHWLPALSWHKPYTDDGKIRNLIPLYTAPPKREWFGLTDDEIEDAWIEASDEYDDTISINNLGRILEAKLKEKNT